jgi:predicted N-formylglutamate amidohydrolase
MSFFLAPDEPAPQLWLNPAGRAPVLLICEHAGQRIPRCLGNLGLPAGEIDRHIGWDIGAGAVTAELARLLDAPAILGVYTRLAVDLNRDLDEPSLIPPDSDGTDVPVNAGLSETEVQQRLDVLFHPFHAAISDWLATATAAGRVITVVNLHSFTPVMEGCARPWHIGILWKHDGRVALPLLAGLRAEGDLTVGDNEPYCARTGRAHTLLTHTEDAGRPGVMLEIRQNEIADDAGAHAWAGRLARLLRPILILPDLRQHRHFPTYPTP